MQADKSYLLPTIYSIVLHILIVVLLFIHWNNTPPHYMKTQLRIVSAVEVDPKALDDIDRQIKASPKDNKPKPKPKPVEQSKPEPPKPDAIAIEKQEKELKQKEEAQKADEQKKLEEQKKADEQKKQDELKEKIRKQALEDDKNKKKKQLAAEAAKQALAEQALAEQANSELPPNAKDNPNAGALDGDEDMAILTSKIKKNWFGPKQAKVYPLVEVKLDPTGKVLDVKIVKSSGNDVFDRTTEEAIRRSDPLPVPKDPVRFESTFKDITFEFNPNDQ